MTSNTICSKQIDLSKKIKIRWIIITAIFVLISIFSLTRYSEYKKAQKEAVEIMCTVTDQFDDVKDNYRKLVKEIYKYFHPTPIPNVGIFSDFDNKAVKDSMREVDRALANYMKNLGYDCYLGSEYLRYTGAIEYSIRNYGGFYFFWGIFALCFLCLTIWELNNAKKTILLESGRVICKTDDKITKEFFISDIKSIDLTAKKGILIRGDEIKYKIYYLENAEEIKSSIMNYKAQIQNDNSITHSETTSTTTINTEEIKKFKELLDCGAITQEEFEKKKKELLKL